MVFLLKKKELNQPWKAQLKLLLLLQAILWKNRSKNNNLVNCRKYSTFHPEIESHSAFECLDYLLTFSRGRLVLLAFELTQ